MRYTEADFQSKGIVGHLVNNLKWKEGYPQDVDMTRWLIPSDLLWFLQQGNKSNERSFENLMEQYGSPSDLVEDFITDALMPKLTAAANALLPLKQSITFKGQSFSLFNEPPVVGSSPNQDILFDKNAFKVVQEATFERQYPNIGKRLNRRPDLTFFVNGIYWGYSELKLSTQGQSASNHGREKIASNFIESVVNAIESTLHEEGYTPSTMPTWSNFSNRASIYNRFLQNVVLFTKAVHITAIDDSRLYMIDDIIKFIPDIYEAVTYGMKSSEAIRALRELIPSRIKDSFQKIPTLRDITATQSVIRNLANIYDRNSGIYREMEIFSPTINGKIIRPRSAQRVMHYSVVEKVTEIYLDELTPKLSPEKIRNDLLKSLPNISEKDLHNEVRELSKYRNGQEQHSILLQGAAGLGKTHLMVWLAYHFANMYHPEKLNWSKPVYEKLFDTIILLSDRTELRNNIAKDADKSLAKEANTTEELVKHIKNDERIIIYNIQKILGLKNALTPELKESLKNKRIVFIIDEVHRTQNGDMNKDTIDLFEACSDIEMPLDKRNLIVGLTATPTEDILAKYGEWRAPSSPADKRNWIPFFSYTMREAIDGGYILDPTQNIMTVTDKLEFISACGENVLPSIKSIYANENRQRLMAAEIAKIFVKETMNAIRPPKGRNSGRGEGKALVVENSVETAIQMKPLIEEALEREANKVVDNLPPGSDKKTIESAHAMRTAILNIVVTMVFSDTAKEKCSTYNDGLSENAIISKFRCENSLNKNSIMIVVDKLLTGFDEPTIHTIFINKNMSGIALFQAVCRINRTHPNKKHCLVVDMSHKNMVARNIPSVFEEYGDITTGDFDAFTLQQKLNKSYNALFSNNHEVAEQFKLWKTWNDDRKKELPVELLNSINSLFEGSIADLEKAFSIWKNCSQWLSIYRKLVPLIDFTQPFLIKHNDMEKRDFAELLRRTLYTKIKDHQQDNNTGEITFDVVKIEETYGIQYDEDIEEEAEPDDKKKSSSKKGEHKHTNKTGIPCIDGFDFIDALNLNEEEKEKFFTDVKGCVIGIFKKMDEISEKQNNGLYKKKIRSGEHMDWEEEQTGYDQIYHQATTGISRKKFLKQFSLFKDLDASLRSKPSLICAEYKAWLLGESLLCFQEIEDNEI